MSAADRFFDTNVLLYLLSADPTKADLAEAAVSPGGVVSTQVLNEFAAVAAGKFGFSFAHIREALEPIRMLCKVEPVTVETHDLGLRIAERYRLHVYDAMIVAAAVLAGCKTLVTEDMHDGQRIEGLKVRNPFAGRRTG